MKQAAKQGPRGEHRLGPGGAGGAQGPRGCRSDAAGGVCKGRHEAPTPPSSGQVPLLQVKGPLLVVQLLESTLLCLVNYAR